MENVVELKNVIKEYKVFSTPKKRLAYSLFKNKRFAPQLFNAVDDVTFSIKKGEILGIIGRNGAGKSTILKLITGVSFPTSGDLKVKGRISSLLELGAGFNPELTGMENIFFQGNLLGINKHEMEKRVPDILEFAAIGDFINQPVKNYSSGMFARLAFATAINVDPDILIVDEVLAVGDIAFQFKCIEKMKEFSKQGVTILFVTHSMMSLYRFCDRAIWIDKGKVIMDGEVEDVVPQYEDSIKMMDNASSLASQSFEQQENVIFKLDEVAMLQSGTKVNEISCHDDCLLEIQYELTTDLKEAPYFALSIVKDGLTYDMFGIFPSQERYTLPTQKGNYKLEIALNDIALNVGEYDVYFSVSEKNGISQLFFKRICPLKIHGELNSLGLVDIEHEVTISSL